MSRPAIRIENLGKRYIVDHEAKARGGYRTLRETLVDLAAAPLRRLKGEGRTTHEEFWALKDVSFEVQPGEVVGIIGRNGAGKSTLLKILSQITKPTIGRIELNGRVGSLLEVGTGFHPELTGRENIYLNGSILGMRKAEIDRKFDEIVDFAEIEQFLDTPVKRYSSGMYVRLAFAVAAHLEPEILIIDEVLAVGDLAFQQKCLGTLGSFAQSGRTVLLVTHNMAAVSHFTKQAVLLASGMIKSLGSTTECMQAYLDDGHVQDASRSLLDAPRHAGLSPILDKVHVRVSAGEHTSCPRPDSSVEIWIRVDPSELPAQFEMGIGINDDLGTRLATVGTYFSNCRALSLDGAAWIQCTTAPLNLAPGSYRLKVAISANGHTLDEVEDATTFRVEDSDYYGSGRLPGPSQGRLLIRSNWKVQKSPPRLL
jgi:homopolymeric O-antigen transport system ATP-binding protein